MAAIQDLTYQVYDFRYSKNRDNDLDKFTRFLSDNKFDYAIAYNEYKRDSIQVTVTGSLNDMAILEYCLNNGMIL